MAAITKFTYLKEFVIPKVRKSIDGLPFTPEGYEKAKSILKECYGNDSEVEKAYVKDILELPKVSGNQPQKLQFYKWLLYNVQSLETLGKLNKVNGNVALTIDKLPGIREDLVCNNEDWQSWDFGSELHASPHIHIWIGHTHIWTYMDKTIWENALYVG